MDDPSNIYVPLTLIEESPVELKHMDTLETNCDYKQVYQEVISNAFKKAYGKKPNYELELVLVKHKTWRGFKVSQKDIEGKSRLLLRSGGVFVYNLIRMRLVMKIWTHYMLWRNMASVLNVTN
jgi:hypothetical protein